MQIGIVTAVRTETRAVLQGLREARRVRDRAGRVWCGWAQGARVRLVESGVGFEHARVATALLDPAPDVVVSCGFAGALRDGVETGALVVCDRLLWESAGETRSYAIQPGLLALQRASVAELAEQAVEGALLSSPVVLATAEAKETAGRRHGAVAVEMEGAALARYAERRGVPLLAVRVVLDPMRLSLGNLPANPERSWTAQARVLTTPRTWSSLRVLRRYAVRAAGALTRVSRDTLRRLAARG